MDYNTNSEYAANESYQSSAAPKEIGRYCCGKGCGSSCVLVRPL